MVDKSIATRCREMLKTYSNLKDLKKLSPAQLTMMYQQLDNYSESLYDLFVQLDTCFVPHLEKRQVEKLLEDIYNFKCSVAAAILIDD